MHYSIGDVVTDSTSVQPRPLSGQSLKSWNVFEDVKVFDEFLTLQSNKISKMDRLIQRGDELEMEKVAREFLQILLSSTRYLYSSPPFLVLSVFDSKSSFNLQSN